MRALARFGAPIGALTREDLARPGTVFQIGVAPNRVDVITAIDGVEFADAWPRRITANVAGLAVPVIRRDDLIRNKRATGRAQDQADADRLESPE